VNNITGTEATELKFGICDAFCPIPLNSLGFPSALKLRQIWDGDHRCRMQKRHANPAKETAVKHERIVKESSRLFRDRLWAK
jgi:hypothetical protein